VLKCRKIHRNVATRKKVFSVQVIKQNTDLETKCQLEHYLKLLELVLTEK